MQRSGKTWYKYSTFPRAKILKLCGALEKLCKKSSTHKLQEMQFTNMDIPCLKWKLPSDTLSTFPTSVHPGVHINFKHEG